MESQLTVYMWTRRRFANYLRAIAARPRKGRWVAKYVQPRVMRLGMRKANDEGYGLVSRMGLYLISCSSVQQVGNKLPN